MAAPKRYGGAVRTKVIVREPRFMDLTILLWREFRGFGPRAMLENLRWEEVVEAIGRMVGTKDDDLVELVSTDDIYTMTLNVDVRTHKDPSADIPDSESQAMPHGAVSLGKRDTVQSNALLSQLQLSTTEQPLSTSRFRLRKVWKQNESENGSYNTAGSLKDEEPLPAVQASDT